MIAIRGVSPGGANASEAGAEHPPERAAALPPLSPSAPADYPPTDREIVAMSVLDFSEIPARARRSHR
jgi:hypothetical protein